MFDTYLCVVGTALNRPERRLITSTDALVASFRVASHPRRFDSKQMKWVDAPSLRIKVNCWRRLGEHVCSSIIAGDPVVVYGRISTRTWKTESGEARISYELEADSVGHDLARGTAEFRKTRLDVATTVVEDADSENRVNGELTESLDDDLAHEDHGYEEHLGYGAHGGEQHLNLHAPATDLDAMNVLRKAGLDPASPDAEDGDDEVDAGEEDQSGAASGSGGSAGRGRRRGRQPVPA